jgi:recombination protein RecA
MAQPVKKKKRISRDSDARALMNAVNQELDLENPVRLGSDEYFIIERIPTGSFVLDRITGGGLALGRHYEFFGSESSGKSYTVYRTMALSQERGNLCAIVDPEHSFDNERFSSLGGRPEELLAFHPDNAEDGVAVMMLLAKHAKEQVLEIISVDSVSSLVPREEMAKDPREEDRIASQARMMSRALRRITAVNKKTLFLWTNQERENIAVRFGNPRTTSGGRALRFYATGRIEFQRGARIKEKRKIVRDGKLVETEVTTGRWIQVMVEKDKSTRPGRMGSFVFDYDLKTVDPYWELISLGLEDEMVLRNTAGQYTYEDIDGKVWSGNERKFRGYLRHNEELYEEIAVAVRDESRRQGLGLHGS